MVGVPHIPVVCHNPATNVTQMYQLIMPFNLNTFPAN